MWLDDAVGGLLMTTLVRFLSISAIFLVGGCSASDPGTSNANGGDAAAGTTGGTASAVAADGYITAGPWAGSGFTATDPGAATITPDCAAGCTPPFTGSNFCMQGTVTGRADYTGFAMLGWNVNQPPGGSAMTWPVPASGGITVTVDNKPSDTALRIQLQGTNPHDAADRWCVALVNGQFTPWSAFKTNCWQGGTPQNTLGAGTMLQQAAILVPGLPTALPFDVCLTDIRIQQ